MNTVAVLVFALGCLQLATGRLCGEHAHFEDCGTACPLTCANYQNPPTVCTLQCVRGCFCDAGYVLDDDQHCCVLPSDCSSQECGENEQFSNCTSLCQPYCENRNPICVDVCVQGCECVLGYIRNVENGTCIPIENCNNSNCQCPGENEVYVNCTGCQPTCSNPNITDNCSLPCTPGCICTSGFIRNDNGDCIAQEQCDAVTASPCDNSTTTEISTPTPSETIPTLSARSHSNRLHAQKHHGNKRHHSNENHARHHSERHSARNHEAKHHEGKHHEGKHHEGKHHEGKHHENKHHESKHHAGKHHEGKHHESKHHEAKQHEANQYEVYQRQQN